MRSYAEAKAYFGRSRGGLAGLFFVWYSVGHDQLFKDFLRAFLREFLELFYPDVAQLLDFSTVRFFDKELFTDFPEGSLREADLVAEVRTTAGEPELLLIHLEVQTERERGFEARMFQYYALLWLRYRLPIFPVVVYLMARAGGLTEQEYRATLWGREVLRFCYQSVALPDLDAGEYVASGNPVAAALAALMERGKTLEGLTLRALMMQRVAQGELDPARKFLLVNLIETYFALAADEADAFSRLLAREEFTEVREMQVTWADKMMEKGVEKGLEKGRQEGRQEGLLEGRRSALLRLMSQKFGPLPLQVTERIQALDSAPDLDAYLDRLLSATSLAEMGLG